MPTHDPFSGVSNGGRSLVLREGKPRAMLDRVGMRVTGGAALNLEGKLLVAMPSMGDARFEHAVVLMCSYSDKGAMGLIINKPTLDIRMSDVLDQLDISPEPKAAAMAVHYGGPVETGRGFVLHSAEYASRLNTLRVSEHFGMTATLDILEEIARGAGPAQALMMLGYAGWGAGQLEGELARNAWLTAEADPVLVFETPAARKWTRALESLGIDPVSLSSTAGRA